MAERRSGLPFEEELEYIKWRRFESVNRAESDQRLIEVILARLEEVEVGKGVEVLKMAQTNLANGGYPSNRIDRLTYLKNILSPLCDRMIQMHEEIGL